jgi:phosphocarrier protein
MTKLLRDFYSAYERYFLTTDPLLTSLATMSLSTDARRLLLEIQDQIARIAQRLEPPQPATASFEEIYLVLKVSGTPFDVIETTADYTDIRVVEPRSLVAVTYLFSAMRTCPTERDVEALRERIAASGERYSSTFIVSPSGIPASVASYAERRGVKLISADELRALFSQADSSATILVGRLSAASLARTLNVDKIYISPDAVPTRPGDWMEERYFTQRYRVDDVIDEFLGNSESRILVLLGDYGSGKSAVAAHTLERFANAGSPCCAAYVPLAQLDDADHLVDTARRADNTLRALYPLASQRLVILDGLDELRDAMTPVSRKKNMLRLLDASTKTDKLLVTVRTSYFRGLEDFWNLFSRADDQALWEKLAKHIPEGSGRPRVQAAILREFDSAKILEYATAVGLQQGDGPKGGEEFLERVRRNDPDAVYQRLMRSPLYLFLIANTIPWEDSSVQCLADVIRLFIRYWLERDVSKGPSRWLVSTDDRADFISDVSWWMFQNGRTMLSYGDFDELVARHFGIPKDTDAARTLGLDLHTTGVFSSVGKTLFFAMPAFSHYFVALRFHGGFDKDWPNRVATVAEAKMWLGLAVAHQRSFSFNDPPERADAWIKTMGIDEQRRPKFVYDLRGVYYGDRKDTLKFLNEDMYRRLASVLWAALHGKAGEGRIAGQRVSILVANKLGLHARAAAGLVRAISRVFVSPPNQVTLIKGGEAVDGFSILGILLLAVGRGSVVDFVFRDCEASRVTTFLKTIGAKQLDDGSDIWSTDFGEREGRGGMIMYGPIE